MIPDEIVAIARTQIKTPFRHQGRIPGKALDCAGLIVHIAHELGLDYVDQTNYPRRPYAGLLEAALDAQPCLRRVERAPQTGDVLLFRIASDPQHLAICAGETIIHAWAEPGCVSENIFTAKWRSQLVRVYEFTGVTA